MFEHTMCSSNLQGTQVVFPPAPKKGMVRFSKKGHFQRATTCYEGTFKRAATCLEGTLNEFIYNSYTFKANHLLI